MQRRNLIICVFLSMPFHSFSSTTFSISAPPRAIVGELVSITLESNLENAQCGLHTNYVGTGDETTFTRIGLHGNNFPFTYKKIFNTTGKFTIASEGKAIGLTSGCKVPPAEAKIEIVNAPPPKSIPPEVPTSELRPPQAVVDLNLEKAMRGDIAAMMELAESLVKQGDDVGAVKWFAEAAKQGNAKAMNALGLYYQEGRGVPQNYSEAHKYYIAAIRLKNYDALVNRGVMFHKGLGVLKNNFRAYSHFNVAAAYVTDQSLRAEAIRLRDELEKSLSPAQIKQAQAEASSFDKKQGK